MPFYLLTLDESDLEKMKHLSFLLLQSPNGTPLCGAQAIKTPNLLGALRIYWLDNDFATPYRIEQICLLDGVKSFRKLSEISVSIYDSEWLWNDNYIDNVFAKYVNDDFFSKFTPAEEEERADWKMFAELRKQFREKNPGPREDDFLDDEQWYCENAAEWGSPIPIPEGTTNLYEFVKSKFGK